MLTDFWFVALSMRELSQTDEERKQAEALKETEINFYTVKTGILTASIMQVCQVVTTVVFCWRARKVKEINWLPKLIMGLISIEAVKWTTFYIASSFFAYKASQTV